MIPSRRDTSWKASSASSSAQAGWRGWEAQSRGVGAGWRGKRCRESLRGRVEEEEEGTQQHALSSEDAAAAQAARQRQRRHQPLTRHSVVLSAANLLEEGVLGADAGVVQAAQGGRADMEGWGATRRLCAVEALQAPLPPLLPSCAGGASVPTESTVMRRWACLHAPNVPHREPVSQGRGGGAGPPPAPSSVSTNRQRAGARPSPAHTPSQALLPLAQVAAPRRLSHHP